MAAEHAESRFPVMGSDGHLIVVGDPQLLTLARERLEECEARWSRFRSGSELCALNAAAGSWIRLSPPTLALVSLAVRAWEVTGGLFDPTVLPALESVGYLRSFGAPQPDSPADPMPVSAPGCAGIEFRRDMVRLPRGVRIDLGGIGKGYAADLIAADLIAAGAEGVSVNLGGDLCVAGVAPGAQPWGVAVADETAPESDLAHVALTEGAVATSTRLRRRWQQHGRDRHHLIDPRTGTSTSNGVDAVTVIAGEAYWAEVLAKAALIAGIAAGTAVLEKWGVAGLIVTKNGSGHRAGPWERFVTWAPNCPGT
ncbi:FAD:protein FMN transferase [Nocardia asiatica]